MILLYAAIPGTAHAYVDPGSGGVIITAILGLIGAATYTVKKYFYKVKNIFSRHSSLRPEDADKNND